MTNRVTALEQDVQKLDEVELSHFAKWFADFQERAWDEQFAKDALAGKLDFLRDEAHAEKRAGTLRDL